MKNKWWRYLGHIGAIIFFAALFVPDKIWLPPQNVIASNIMIGVAVLLIAINGFMRTRDNG